MKLFYAFIDEDEKDGKRFKDVLLTRKLEVKYYEPEPSIDFFNKILKRERFSGIILDYRLSYRNKQIQYDAPTLAAHIREDRKKYNIPIVALSGIVRPDQVSNTSFRELFDWFLEKIDVANNALIAQNQLISLAEGYLQISSHIKTRKSHSLALQKILCFGKDYDGIAKWLEKESNGKPNRIAY
jgi:hypothetical protein